MESLHDRLIKEFSLEQWTYNSPEHYEEFLEGKIDYLQDENLRCGEANREFASENTDLDQIIDDLEEDVSKLLEENTHLLDELDDLSNKYMTHNEWLEE